MFGNHGMMMGCHPHSHHQHGLAMRLKHKFGREHHGRMGHHGGTLHHGKFHHHPHFGKHGFQHRVWGPFGPTAREVPSGCRNHGRTWPTMTPPCCIMGHCRTFEATTREVPSGCRCQGKSGPPMPSPCCTGQCRSPAQPPCNSCGAAPPCSADGKEEGACRRTRRRSNCCRRLPARVDAECQCQCKGNLPERPQSAPAGQQPEQNDEAPGPSGGEGQTSSEACCVLETGN